jgi:hypothetical protein
LLDPSAFFFLSFLFFFDIFPPVYGAIIYYADDSHWVL